MAEATGDDAINVLDAKEEPIKHRYTQDVATASPDPIKTTAS